VQSRTATASYCYCPAAAAVKSAAVLQQSKGDCLQLHSTALLLCCSSQKMLLCCSPVLLCCCPVHHKPETTWLILSKKTRAQALNFHDKKMMKIEVFHRELLLESTDEASQIKVVRTMSTI
jgi:hypothetical protein